MSVTDLSNTCVLLLVNKIYTTENKDLCCSEPCYLTPKREASYVQYLVSLG